jgi:predicted amidophosphoribosyltransferase
MTKVSENHKGNNANTVLATELCPNCKETIEQCACMHNICHKCGKPVGNITFTICDECWDIEFPPKS